mmetsp:Transcript_9126/g.30250  ORF Transcript_9126/g.30250 Transcript_9126/m.30250 type:complete len:233 (-) Transcript_9126:207-905(-)
MIGSNSVHQCIRPFFLLGFLPAASASNLFDLAPCLRSRTPFFSFLAAASFWDACCCALASSPMASASRLRCSLYCRSASASAAILILRSRSASRWASVASSPAISSLPSLSLLSSPPLSSDSSSLEEGSCLGSTRVKRRIVTPAALTPSYASTNSGTAEHKSEYFVSHQLRTRSTANGPPEAGGQREYLVRMPSHSVSTRCDAAWRTAAGSESPLTSTRTQPGDASGPSTRS